MARYEHLPLFKSVYDFQLYFFKLSNNFAKDYKYGLAQEVRINLVNLMDKIIAANNMTDKATILSEAEIVTEQIKIKGRMLRDLKVMSLKSYEYFFRQLTEISKQIKAWESWSQRGRS